MNEFDGVDNFTEDTMSTASIYLEASNDSDQHNGTDFAMEYEEYIYDKVYIRIIFISLYTVVFCLCFFGNLLVILVVTLSRRLRSITNFFLANLAVADFCVAVFCVYQNLFIYFVDSWMLGEFLCKMYMFIQSLSNTASIFILVIICIERYFAIIYPITCKQILTPRRLRLIILGVWITCILYSAPKFYWGNTVTVPTKNMTETMCVLNRTKYNSELFDVTHFVLFYNIPLIIMSLLYSRIAICLWNSSQQLKKQLNASTNPNQYQGLCQRQSSRYRSDKKVANGDAKLLQNSSSNMSTSNSSQNVLAARRGVIKMLIIVVCAFAVCNLPFHARKMWQYRSSNYHGDTNFSALFTPLTFLATYFNSGVNPLLYAFLSKNFRRGMREILLCSCRRRRQPGKSNHLSLHVGIQRHASTRSTVKANATTVTIVNNDHSSECSHDV
ncbi:trissin receptor [Tribolium castaneum]|uniref:Tachykinin-like peptides receptor 99D n=1 Tax=Tribolium castaneum TaxID=7070 RepID=D6WJ65_TRICA|nr:PREDICTED: allatostatin-A receptor [Tribolium castaneum]XP_975121.1 PREDICTED: allatostatin-A receptor [Tribolium castaneum]EFA04697.1 Tachykinin-like peptides receptor 99D [Tribolium castaneum]|eukprot:XP_015836095.1 PREDICTED: allatostatin-A receptor [Tribolium castaneum]